MSKNRIKNIKHLGVKKMPYLVYSNNQYKDLLLKLKKYTVWSLQTKKHVQQILTHEKINVQTLYNISKKVKSSKINRLAYNPQLNKFSLYETFFFKKIKF